MCEADVQPTWEYLVKQERSLRRNLMIARIIQPVGALICAWNLLLIGMNLLLFLAADKIGGYFEKLPILPSLIDSMPRDGWGTVTLFSVLLAYVLPLAICGLIVAVFYLVERYKGLAPIEPLNGTQVQCAIALNNKAENVYEIRRKMPRWSIYSETGILTLITAVPIGMMFVDYASDGAMALQLALVAIVMLVVLFGFFWLYAFVMYTFSLLNSLLYLSEGQWKLYELYQWVSDYRDMVDPVDPES